MLNVQGRLRCAKNSIAELEETRAGTSLFQMFRPKPFDVGIVKQSTIRFYI